MKYLLIPIEDIENEISLIKKEIEICSKLKHTKVYLEHRLAFLTSLSVGVVNDKKISGKEISLSDEDISQKADNAFKEAGKDVAGSQLIYTIGYEQALKDLK